MFPSCVQAHRTSHRGQISTVYSRDPASLDDTGTLHVKDCSRSKRHGINPQLSLSVPASYLPPGYCVQLLHSTDRVIWQQDG